MSTLEQAIAIAAIAQRGAMDKGGAPYILHPLRVMLRMRRYQQARDLSLAAGEAHSATS